MSGKDDYYNRAKQEGYRARSAYKLQQLDETAGLLGEGRTVVDLGAAPGGWLQVAAERVGSDGRVIGVDRQRIDPLEDVPAPVETVRGDITEEDTVDSILDAVGGSNAEAGDAGGGSEAEAGGGSEAEAGGGSEAVDVVLSDVAPNMSGEYDLDHARSVHLARQAFAVALDVLDSGGDLAVKVFDGRDLADLEADVDAEFEYVRQVRPDASRDESSELYLVAKGRLTAPVREGDELGVEITDTGREGDGIAKVEGYTLFVPEANEGETVSVRVTDVKPRFGFAERVDE